MTYFLDSNFVISAIKNKIPDIEKKMKPISHSSIKVPSMVRAELIAGAYNGHDVKNDIENINGFLSPYEVIPFDKGASDIYGRIWAELEKTGRRIGANDLIIAATVMSNGGILVTNNTKEFSRIKGLHLEDWST